MRPNIVTRSPHTRTSSLDNDHGKPFFSEENPRLSTNYDKHQHLVLDPQNIQNGLLKTNLICSKSKSETSAVAPT